MIKNYNSIIKEKGLSEISYQKDFLTNGKFLASKKPLNLRVSNYLHSSCIVFCSIFLT
jgi:hypothetical protein